MKLFILDTDTELNKFYLNLFKKKYPSAEVIFVFSGKDLLAELDKIMPIAAKAVSIDSTTGEMPDDKIKISSHSQNQITDENAAKKTKNSPDTRVQESIDSVYSVGMENNICTDNNTEETSAPDADQHAEPVIIKSENTAETLPADKQKNQQAIIITEIRINDMDIFNLLNELRPRKIPTIVVSSESSERMIVECLRGGAFDYLSKRNIKLGYFQDILDRAVLSLDIKNELEMFENQKFHKLNKKILQSLSLEKSEVTRNRLSRGIVSTEEITLEEGNIYFIIFMYVQLGVPTSVSTTTDENRLKFICEKYISKFSDIAAKYGHTFSLNKTNGCLFGFMGNTHFQAIIAALEIIAEMNLFNVKTENLHGKIDANIALASGKTKYKHKIGTITSDALNLCAHMALKAPINHGIMITEDIYNNIGPRAMKIFQKTDKFEGHTAYLHSPLKNAMNLNE